MPPRVAGLTAQSVKHAAPGRYGDGDGLYLLVRTRETAFWIFRYTRAGKMREMGLGRARGDKNVVSLKDAREAASKLYQSIRSGRDPLADRETAAALAKVDAQTAVVKADHLPGDSRRLHQGAHCRLEQSEAWSPMGLEP